MSRTYFLASADWQELKAEMEKRKEAYTQDALTALAHNADMTLSARQYARGVADGLGIALDLPNEILKDGDQNGPEEQPVEGTRITPHPADVRRRPSRAF